MIYIYMYMYIIRQLKVHKYTLGRLWWGYFIILGFLLPHRVKIRERERNNRREIFDKNDKGMLNDLTDNNQHFSIIRISLWVIFIKEYSNKIFWIFSIIYTQQGIYYLKKFGIFRGFLFYSSSIKNFHGILYSEKFLKFYF